MKKDSKAVGVRIPLRLFKLVRAAEPDVSFSQIVISALLEKYVDEEDLDEFLSPKSKFEYRVKRAESEIDRLIQYIDNKEVCMFV